MPYYTRLYIVPVRRSTNSLSPMSGSSGVPSSSSYTGRMGMRPPPMSPGPGMGWAVCTTSRVLPALSSTVNLATGAPCYVH